jgi:hypothetical protein
MAAKLTEITTQYHTFVDDQVLTKDQLNGFISYFEDQDRMTRAFLHGVGTVCGLNLKDITEKSITITQGVGVTTDGDLITLRQPVSAGGVKSIELKEQVLTHYRKFEDKFAAYPFFRRIKTVDGKTTTELMEMWELFPDAVENSKTLDTLENLKDKTVVLYLESYAKEGDLCTTIDCDNQGVEQVARLRILLVSKNDAAYIAKNDSIFSKHDVAQKFTDLPELAVRRVVLNQLNTANYNALKQAYHSALNSHSLQTNLNDGIAKLFSGFGNLLQLDPLKNQFNKFPENLKKLAGFTSANIPFDFQYRYDLLKDLVDTWNEIRCLLLSLKEECFPDINAFPKHLLLGNLDEMNIEPKQNRHQFYKSPALTCGLSKLNQIRSLIQRFFEMVDGYGSKSGEVKITPSNKLPELSFRSIPFYFRVDEKLLKVWNFIKTKKFSHTKNLSYHRENLANLPQIQEPLNFNTDRFDFLRIEGHQGKNYKTVLEEILDLKQIHGLAFDVKALSINVNTENLNIDDYECEFEDLNMLLRAWTAEQECVLAEVSQLFSGFSTAEPGKNVKEVLVAGRKSKETNLNLLTNASADTSRTKRILTNLEASKATFEKQTTDQKIFSTYYTKSNVVPDNLVTEKNTLGVLMKTAFDETPGGSVNDIIARANKLVTENVDQALWAEQPEMKEFIIDQSIELMAYTHVLSQRMPNVLVNVSVARVDTYKLTLKELCALVDRLKVRYQNIELSSNLKALMGVLITHLSGICCSAKKLEILLEEINKRKEKIILRLRLSEFIKHHPGLEHKAGVEPGGTFILVYLNKIQNEIVREESPGNLSRVENLTHLSAAESLRITDTKALSVKDTSKRVTELEKFAELLKKENRSKDDITKIEKLITEERSRLVGIVQAVAEIPNNTVVADFSLPYLCCSDCAPVNFIIQKPPAWLRLEKDKICLGQDTEVRFEVSPEDGEIRSNPEVSGMTIENKKLVFDPSVFPEELLGEKITFTVNQQVTEAELTVFKAPQVDFEAPERAPVGLEITFESFGDIEGAFFLWDFGDGSPTSTEKSPKHRYTELPDNEDNSVVVKLVATASNGVCTATAEHKIQLFEIIIEVNLDGRDFCENDESPHLFTVVTEGTTATVSGPGVEQDENGNFVFIPAKAGKGEHTFNVNGEPSDIVVTVHEAPVPKFEPSQDGNKLILTNHSTGADSFIWIINEEEIERDDTSPVVIELKPDSPTRYILQLIAVSEHCGRVETEKIRFETEPVEPPAENCLEVTTEAILQDLETLQKLNLPGSNFVVPIWMSTSQLYGGTDEFKEGVLNDVENFLTGNNNDNLPELFLELLTQTSHMIFELSGNPDNTEFRHLIELFALQLRLFYNILGCQENEVLENSKDILARMFEHIIAILQQFREREIKLPESLRTFMEEWAEKVAGKPILEEHVKMILDNNLI